MPSHHAPVQPGSSPTTVLCVVLFSLCLVLCVCYRGVAAQVEQQVVSTRCLQDETQAVEVT